VELTEGADPNADISATLSADGNWLTLFVVNCALEPVTRELDLSALGVAAQQAQVWTLADTLQAGEPDAFNSFAEPERVSTTKTTFQVAGPQFNYAFGALSLTVIRVKTGGM
jgi:alpha-L-arabinofuranosidase